MSWWLDLRQCSDGWLRAGFLPRREEAKPGYPDHAIAKAQQAGFGAMLSFDIKGDIGGVRRFVEALRVFTLAESLGGIESLVAHPATMTHASMSPDARRVAGIGDTLLRLSVGLEAEVDLMNDLRHGFSVLSANEDRTT